MEKNKSPGTNISRRKLDILQRWLCKSVGRLYFSFRATGRDDYSYGKRKRLSHSQDNPVLGHWFESQLPPLQIQLHAKRSINAVDDGPRKVLGSLRAHKLTLNPLSCGASIP